jgi:hypothetical protein
VAGMINKILTLLILNNIKVISIHQGSSVCFILKKSNPSEIHTAIDCLRDITVDSILDTKAHRYQYLFVSSDS